MSESPDLPSGKLLLERRSQVTVADTDAAGLIYFAAPYRWAEASSTAWWSQIGHPMGATLRAGWATPLVHSEADYLGPLTVDDPLRLELYSDHVGRTSFGFQSRIYCGDEERPRVITRSRHVYGRMAVKGDPHQGFHAEPLPAWLRDALT